MVYRLPRLIVFPDDSDETFKLFVQKTEHGGDAEYLGSVKSVVWEGKKTPFDCSKVRAEIRGVTRKSTPHFRNRRGKKFFLEIVTKLKISGLILTAREIAGKDVSSRTVANIIRHYNTGEIEKNYSPDAIKYKYKEPNI